MGATSGGISRRLSVGNLVSAAQRRARADYFVGRETELANFAELIAARRWPRIVFVHGPGGIGKSSLLQGFAEIAERAGCGVVGLDARQLAPAPRMIGEAVDRAVEKLPADSDLPRVLMLDHVEQLSALDGWLRGQWLPNLPADLLLVLAGRQGPDAHWRADPGVSALLTEYALEPLDADAVAEYMRRRGIGCDQAQAVQTFARGHPLPLALAIDQVLREPDKLFDIDQFPDLIRALVQWLLGEVEHPEDLQTLQACATVRRLDEPLLAAMLESDDAARQFDWLADQHYTERQTHGLVIHDLVREIVIRDLRCRNLARHHELIRRAFNYMMEGADTTQEKFRVKTVPGIIYTLRQEAHIRKHLGFGAVRCYPDTAQVDEITSLAAEVEKLESAGSRSWFEYWSRHPASELVVIRETGQRPVAFALFLRLDAATMATESDPCVQALLRHLREYAPLREAEQVLLARFRMAHQTHQSLTPAWAELSTHLNGRMFTPGISMLASVSDTRYDWSGMEDNAEYHLLRGSKYHIDGREYMLSAHDLRREPALAWAHKTVQRILADGRAPELKPAPIILLDKPTFTEALREVLRHYHDDESLARNPLLHSPMLRRHAGDGDASTLRSLIEQTSAAQPADVHAMLTHVYFQPTAVKQQAIASELCISERTLRRRLRSAEDKLIESLWRFETQA